MAVFNRPPKKSVKRFQPQVAAGPSMWLTKKALAADTQLAPDFRDRYK